MPRLALALLLACLLLTACSPTVILLGDKTETPTRAPTLKPPLVVRTPRATLPPKPQISASPDDLRGISISLWHGLDGESGTLLAQMADEFSRTNTWGIRVDVVSQKNLSLLVESVEAALDTPEQPDLALAFPEYAQTWDAQGQVIDLTPYIADPNVGLTDAEIQDIPSVFWKQGQVDAKRLSVPAMRTGRFLFYNTSFAKELGFNSPPQSADDFRKQACAANASWKTDDDQSNDGFGGWVLENDAADTDAPWTAYGWLNALGGNVYTNGNYAFFTPKNREALGFLAKLRSDGCAWLSSALSNYEALAVHKALFAAGSLYHLRDQRAAFAASPDRWTVIPFPGATPAMVVYGPDYIVLKSSEARQLAAWLFVRWMLSPENQARWQRATGLFPMRASAVDLLDNIRNANPQWSAAMALVAQAKTYSLAPGWPKARLVLGDGFFHIFQGNPTSRDVANALNEMDGIMKDLLP